MSEPHCACAKFERLEGAATQAYATQFLKRTGATEGSVNYRCRECGARWQKTEDTGAKRPSLVRVSAPETTTHHKE